MTDRPQFSPETMAATRINNGYSLRGLAKASGVSFSQLAALERGENQPTPATLQKIATALNLPVSSLLDAAEEEALS